MRYQYGFCFYVKRERYYVKDEGGEGLKIFYTNSLNIRIGQNNISEIKLFKNDYFTYLRPFDNYISYKAFRIYCSCGSTAKPRFKYFSAELYYPNPI